MEWYDEIRSMLQAANNKDYNEAKNILGTVMSGKLQNRLDEEKIKQGSRIFDKEDT